MIGRQLQPSRGSFEVASRASSRQEEITALRRSGPVAGELASDETITRPWPRAQRSKRWWPDRLACLRDRLRNRREASELDWDEAISGCPSPVDSIPTLTSDATLARGRTAGLASTLPDVSRWLRVEVLGVVLGVVALSIIASLPGAGVAAPLRSVHGQVVAVAAITLDDSLSAALYGRGLRSASPVPGRGATAAHAPSRAGEARPQAPVTTGAHLVILFHATDAVRPLYERALKSRVPEAELRIVNSPFGVFANGYRHLMGHLQARYGTHYLAAVARHLGIHSLAEYETITVASFSAGYAAVRAMLDEPASAALIDAVVAIDSWHTEFDPDGSPRDAQLAGLVRFAESSMAEPRICWLRHTDVRVPRVGPRVFASTSQVAAELRRLTHTPADGEDVAVGGWRVSAVDLHADDHAEHVAALMIWGDDWLADAVAALLERRAQS